VTDVVALLGRTSDRANGRAAGALALSADARVVGEPGEPRAARRLYPAPGGLDLTQLRELLAGVAARARIVGAEITCFSTPELSDVLAQAVAPLQESPAP
jgi:hypothetical protein